MSQDQSAHLLCHRCGRELTPGRGEWYIVRIEAFADPSPPILDEELARGGAGISKRIDELLAKMSDMTQRELMDQIYRRLTMHLCVTCYNDWIENPAGDDPKVKK
ncbi:MAG: hypothetical protein HZA50_02280 [Planctomycetes bacterium]|nr:hypothetical protein [Planctomycetota bacterium]